MTVEEKWIGVKEQFERGDESLSSTSLMASTQNIKGL